jgi:drug/metabolite transporter (DMT)-like permease
VSRSLLWQRVAPFAFALLWSTGWISAGAAAPYADPLTFLLVRFSCAAAILAGLVAISRAPWPATRAETGHIVVSGLLIHAVYLAAVWWAVAHGIPAGVSGVIAALQPILTALFAPWLLGERLSPRQWLGVVLGFLGILLVLEPKIATAVSAGSLPAGIPLAINIGGMVAVTLGSIYQKRFVPKGDLRTMALIQYLASAAVMLPAAVLLEPMRIEWNWIVAATLAWSVLALSIGGVALYLMLIRRGAVSQAAALIYLVPPAAAIEAWILFGEKLSAIQLAGIVVTAMGVAWAVKRQG